MTINNIQTVYPPRITHYIFVKAQTEDILEKKLENALAHSWQPYGVPFNVDGNFYQAIVIYEGTNNFGDKEMIKNFRP